MRSISQPPWTGCPDLLGFCVWTWLRPSDTYEIFLPGLAIRIPYRTGCPGSWTFFGIWIFSFFSNCLRDFVCLDFFAANYLRMFASGLGVLTPAREHSSRGSSWPSLLHTCSLQGEPELDKLVESWGLYTLETWDFFFFILEILF